MICTNCNRNIVKPLELYNGDWACPSCKTVVGIKSIAVKVNKENDETFKLSELCYLRALKSQQALSEYERNLAVAIEYCRTAARMGNPKALIRLGFYYEHGYITADVTESFRIAYEYYKLVWSSMPEMEERPADRDYAESCIKLRCAAAKHYLELLKKLPESFRRVGDLNYHDEREKIIAKGLTVPDDDGAERVVGESRALHVLSVLQSCLTKERSPLFGIMRLERGDYAELSAIRTGAKNGESKLLTFARKLLIVLFDADNGEFRTIKTAEDVGDIEPDSAYYLYFFNGGGEHGISESKCKRIGKTLRKNTGFGEYSGVKRIIDAMSGAAVQTDYVFSEDDVLMYKNSRLESFAHATDDLINKVAKQ
ncbi:MAG: hypothetical protein K2J01_03430 [Clostridiales bacterium]|nr:hypothetical protein [Clostridiales bacterium]